MKNSALKLRFAILCLGVFSAVGCNQSVKPEGPKEGSVQEYLNANPDVAARIDEESEEDDDGGDGSDE